MYMFDVVKHMRPGELRQRYRFSDETLIEYEDLLRDIFSECDGWKNEEAFDIVVKLALHNIINIELEVGWFITDFAVSEKALKYGQMFISCIQRAIIPVGKLYLIEIKDLIKNLRYFNEGHCLYVIHYVYNKGTEKLIRLLHKEISNIILFEKLEEYHRCPFFVLHKQYLIDWTLYHDDYARIIMNLILAKKILGLKDKDIKTLLHSVEYNFSGDLKAALEMQLLGYTIHTTTEIQYRRNLYEYDIHNIGELLIKNFTNGVVILTELYAEWRIMDLPIIYMLIKKYDIDWSNKSFNFYIANGFSTPWLIECIKYFGIEEAERLCRKFIPESPETAFKLLHDNGCYILSVIDSARKRFGGDYLRDIIRILKSQYVQDAYDKKEIYMLIRVISQNIR